MAEPETVGADPAPGSAPCPQLPKESQRGKRGRGRERSEAKERRKLISHVAVLRARAERLNSTAPDRDPKSSANRKVSDLLDQEDWCKSVDLSSMHDHADQLEELLPYIAGESYLRTELAYELTRTDEPIRLIKLLPEAQLCELRRLSSSTPSCTSAGGVDGGDSGEGKRRMADSLSLLARERNGQIRHDRLMTDLRQTYLLFFGVLILGLLLTISLAIGFGTHANPASADTWAQLLLVLSSGALGSVLASASRLKDQLDLQSFRGAVRLTYIQPLVGATFGLISWLILTSGVVKIASASTGWATQAAIAFASGFSEPFALGILRRLTPGNPPAPENRPPS